MAILPLIHLNQLYGIYHMYKCEAKLEGTFKTHYCPLGIMYLVVLGKNSILHGLKP